MRWKNSKVSITDGPYTETKEQLGGFGVFEASDLNHAIQLLSKHPAVKAGIVEIRPAEDLIEMIRESERRRSTTKSKINIRQETQSTERKTMQHVTQTHPVSKKTLWAGYIMGALPVLLLLMSAVMKLIKPPPVVEGFAHLGLPESLALALGILELACTVVYLIPQTSVLGAILLTGYLGGATVTHLRVGDPFFMPVILGMLVWGGLFLRDPRLRALIPLRRQPA